MGRFRGCKTYETQPFGILEFFVSPYSLQLLAKYVHIMIFAFLDPCISTTKRRYFNISCCCLTLCTLLNTKSYRLWAPTVATKRKNNTVFLYCRQTRYTL